MEHFKSDLVACTRREDVSEIVGKCTFKNIHLVVSITPTTAGPEWPKKWKGAEKYRNWVFTIKNDLDDDIHQHSLSLVRSLSACGMRITALVQSRIKKNVTSINQLLYKPKQHTHTHTACVMQSSWAYIVHLTSSPAQAQ